MMNGGQKQLRSSEKIYSIVTQTIEKLKKEGITSKNAKQMNVAKKYNNLFIRFDNEGRLGLILDVNEVSGILISKLRSIGSNVEIALPYSKLIAVYVPIDKIEELAKWDEVNIIRPIVGGVTNTGAVTSEGDIIHHAVDVRTDLNVKGDSIKVGVISDGCVNWAAAQASGDLPAGFGAANFTFLNGNKMGSGDEGTAMMEIVYDLAPNADLYFYGALNDPAGSAAHVDAIQRLVREKGCKVIVDDITWFDQPMFEDGTPATAWTVAAAAQWAIDTGVVYVSSAGNWANGPPNFIDRSHYQAMYSDINPGSNVIEWKPIPSGPPPGPGPILPGIPPNWDDLHFFGPDPDPNPAGPVGLKVVLPAWQGPPNPYPKLYVILEWNDPWGASADDYDLYIYDKNFLFQRAASIGIQVGAQNPYEAVADSNMEYYQDDTVNIVINHRQYDSLPHPPKLLGLYIWGGKWVEHFTPQHSIWGQPGVPDVIAVGAVPYNNINNIEPYSSNGNYDVYFPAYQSRPKPDVVAIDGGVITGAGGFGWWDGANWRFYGTSASAPHVAAMAALLLSKCPTMTPQQVHTKFERTAIDLGVAGFDPIYGFGRADIERAMLEVKTIVGAYGPYQMNNVQNVPMFFATNDGYAIDNITITGGLLQPITVNSKVSVTNGNPYTDAGVTNLGCPTIKRWYQITQNGGFAGGYNASITAYIDESERSAIGVAVNNLRILHWNGSFFDILPQAALPTQVGNTWKIKANYNNADFSPFFVGYYYRGVDVASVSNSQGPNNTTTQVTFSIQNTGNGWDTLSFHVRDSKGWALSPIDSTFSLTASQKVNMNINITISPSDTVGTVDTVWLISKSVSNNSYIDSAFATVTITVGKTTISSNLMDGWNMVSVPLYVDDFSKNNLYPIAVSNAFTYTNSYIAKDTLTIGIGYWIKVNGAQSIDIEGFKCEEETINVHTGWNMIGSISIPVPVNSILSIPGGMITSNFYKYTGTYQTADSIEPGKGYWVKVNQNGQLVLKKSAGLLQTNMIKIIPCSEMPPLSPNDQSKQNTLEIPKEFVLEQNYPNPFNPSTEIYFDLPENSWVKIEIYDILGNLVKTLMNDEMEAGHKQITWNSTNTNGTQSASGIYLVRMSAHSLISGKEFSAIKRMILLR